MSPSLSVIIPTLNEEHYLPRLLESLKKQTYTDFEIIVSDGNSHDQTASIARTYDCRVISQSQRSPAAQRNAGAHAARGTLLLFLDADTILPDTFIEKAMTEYFRKHLDVASFLYILDSPKPIYRLATAYTFIFVTLISHFYPITIGAGMMTTRSWFKKSGGFDELLFLGEDNDFVRKIVRQKGKYGFIRSTRMKVSARRYEKDGAWPSFFKLQYIVAYYMLYGNVRKPIVEYSYGSYTSRK